MSVHPSRRAFVEDEPEDDAMEGIDLSNVPIDRDYFMPSGASGIPTEKASALLSQFDRKRAAAKLAVPTADRDIKARLRFLAEPITLFGEGPAERRDRLRELLLVQTEEGGGDVDVEMGETPEGEAEDEQEFYVRGTNELLEARRHMAEYSLPRAKQRVAFQRLEATIPLKTHIDYRNHIKERLKGFELSGSQIAADRPVSIVRFSPSGEYIAAGHWGGGVKLLGVPNLETKKVYRAGHTDRTTGIDWRPGATLPDSGISSTSLNFASGGGGGNVQLWSLEQDKPIATLTGHNQRVCRIGFHPSGRYLASASDDTSWRLWDVETSTELLIQEGHSKEVFTVSFNGDGSLLASAGLDSIGRVWDIRTGRVIYLMESHIKPIHALDWSTDGHRLLSGSVDGFMKCWDLRAMRETNAIGANSGGITDLRWYKGTDGPASGISLQKSDEGELVPKKASTFVVSCGFDKNVNIFSADDWSLCKSLKGHQGIVLSADISRDAAWVCSSGRDRTVKLWSRDDQEPL